MSPNFRSEYFEYENLTSITGEPDFSSLTKLKNELKANAQSVPTTLGGGNLGFLGLILTDDEYALISDTPFERPERPTVLVFPTGTTTLQSKMIEDRYRRGILTYDQTVAIEKALKQQLVKSIHDDWLAPMRHTTTNAINRTLPQILAFLYTQHGDVTAENLQRKEEALKNLPYDPAIEPIDKIFIEVQELVNFSQAANAGYTMQQTINVAYIIIKKLRIFNKPIIEWNRTIRDPCTFYVDQFQTIF